MAFGLDYVSGPPIADMQAAKVAFVCRYLSEVNPATQVKLLMPQEARALSAAGISIVSNYEWYANRPLEGYVAGVQDAQIAASQHKACGGPVDRPIYFSVDADVAPVDVAKYFEGIASVLGKGRVGAYGSYRVLEYLFNMGLISWGWQTYAWSAGAWEPRAHIQQYLNGVSFSGHSVDYNRSVMPDFGQWRTAMIDLSNPTVAAYFEAAQVGWNCRQTGKNVHGEILDFYIHFGGDALCGLTYLGLPVSNEIALGGSHGAVKQYYENACVFFDPAHEFDSRPGASGARVYLAHLYVGQGQDPEIAKLQALLAQATAGLDPAKVSSRLQAIGLASHNNDQSIQALIQEAL